MAAPTENERMIEAAKEMRWMGCKNKEYGSAGSRASRRVPGSPLLCVSLELLCYM